MPFLSLQSLTSKRASAQAADGSRPRGSIDLGNSSIVLLAAAGFGALLFTLGAGSFVYANTRSLVSAKDWVEHTQEVLTSLQTASLLTDRIEYSIRLYSLNHDEAQLMTARQSAVGLESSAMRIQRLTVDNPQQAYTASTLVSCSASVTSAVRTLTGGDQVPSALLRCREAVGLATERERELLKERSKKSQHSSIVSLSTEGGFIELSLFSTVVLFSFLFRDLLLRRRAARQIALTNQHLEYSVYQLEQRMHESRLLTACRDELQLCTTVQQVYRVAADCLSRLLPDSSGSLAILSNSRHLLEAVSSWGERSTLLRSEHDKGGLAVAAPGKAGPYPSMTGCFSPESCCGLRLGQLRWRSPGVSEIDCTHFNGAAPVRYLCVPMVAQGDTLGMLSIECVEESAYLGVRQRMDGLRQLLQLTGMAIASLNLRTRLENQSIRDGLTGLFNRHFMQVVLERELSRASREQTTLALFMLDVDHFKQFNDSHGHGAGDLMLQAIAEAFTCSVRVEDTVCRYGGEEFAIILPDCTPEVAQERAERIREAVLRLRIPHENAVQARASVSIGIAFYPASGLDAELLLRRADQALYRAKHNGRNQVCLPEALAESLRA